MPRLPQWMNATDIDDLCYPTEGKTKRMKALSLTNPWAVLMALGLKQHETRSWQTTHRGPVVICSTKSVENVAYWCAMPEFKQALKESGEYTSFVDFPYGMALCIADLVFIRPTELIRERLSARELAFGDYSDGRWAWEFQNVRRFRKPIPVRGALHLFDVHLSEKDL